MASSNQAADMGLATLTQTHKNLMIDEEWTERFDRGFYWIGHRLMQLFEASPLWNDDGITLSRITARTLILEDVQATIAGAELELVEMNGLATTSALVLGQKRDLWSVLNVYVHSQIQNWVPQFLGALAIIQLCEAEQRADALADLLGGRTAYRTHPRSGSRHEPDDMLNAIRIFIADGQLESRFAVESEFSALAYECRNSNVATMGGSSEGIALEVPSGGDTALIELSTIQNHPPLGSGLAVRLRLPSSYDAGTCAHISSVLNALEGAGTSNTPQYGGWGWMPLLDAWFVCYWSFVPNRLYQPVLSQNIAYQMVKRARWASDVLGAQQPGSDAWTIMYNRLRRLGAVNH